MSRLWPDSTRSLPVNSRLTSSSSSRIMRADSHYQCLSDEVLGPAGVRFLQSGLVLKAISTALLWALCVWGYAAGKLPDWLHLQFRQVNCLEETKLVLWFVPISKLDGMGKSDIALLVSYVRSLHAHSTSFYIADRRARCAESLLVPRSLRWILLVSHRSNHSRQTRRSPPRSQEEEDPRIPHRQAPTRRRPSSSSTHEG